MNKETERNHQEQVVVLTSQLKECIEKNALETRLQKHGMTIDKAFFMIIKAVIDENQSIHEAVQQLQNYIGPIFLQNLEEAINNSEFFKNKANGSFQQEIIQFFESQELSDYLNITDFENLNSINPQSIVQKYKKYFTQSELNELLQLVQNNCPQQIDLSVKNNSQPIEKEQYQEKPPQEIDYFHTYSSKDIINKQIILKETLQEDLKKYPECAEKTLMELQVHVLAAITHTELNGDSLIQELELIINQFTTQLCETNEFSQDRDNWKEQLCCFVMNKQWNYLLEIIEGIFKIIRPINMFELRRLVEKAKEAGKIIKGKDVILFLGATGSGKSTVIHFLAGTPQVQQDDNIFPDMSRIKYKELKQIIVGNEDTSVTRYITPITINLKESGRLQNETLVLCDAPGFFDNQGVEVDIANGIGIVSSMKECNTLKPVIVFSKLGVGDRGDQFKALIRTLSSLFDGISDNLSSFYYIFNKYSQGDTIEKIQKKIESIFIAEKKMNGELNGASNEFFEDIISKCQSKKDVIKLDLLKGDPNKYVKQLNKDSISNPSEVLQYTISSDSKAQIQSFLGIIQQRLDKYLESRKIDLIVYDIGQLSYLKQILQKQEITQIYDTYILKINQRFKNEQIGLLNEFNRFIDSQAQLDTFLLEKYRNSIQYYKQTCAPLQEHLYKNDNCDECSFGEELESNLMDKIRKMSEKNIDFLQDPQAATFRKIDLENLKLIAMIFPEKKTFYSHLNTRIQEAFQTLISLIKDNIDQKNFQTCGTIFVAMKNAINILQVHYPDKELHVYLANCTKLFREFIDSSIKIIQGYFKNNQIAIKQIEIEYKMLLSLAEVHELECCQKNEAKQSIQDQVNAIFCDYLKRVKGDFFKSQNEHPLDQVKLVLGDIKKMLDLGANQATFSAYYDFKNEIESFIRQTSSKFDECLSKMEKDPKQFITYCRKTQVRLFIKNVRFIEEVLGVSYASQIDQFEEAITHFIFDLENYINLFLQQNIFYDKQNEMIDFSIKINCLNGFKDILPQFESKMVEFEKNVQTRFESKFQEIKQKYQVGSSTIEDDIFLLLDITKIETILDFFKSCLNCNIIQYMTVKNQGQFQVHLQSIFDRIQKETLEILKSIKCNPQPKDSQKLQQYVLLIVEMQKTKNLNELTSGDRKIIQLQQELESIHQHWKQYEQKECSIEEYDQILEAVQILSNLSIFSQDTNKFKTLEQMFISLRKNDTSELEKEFITLATRKEYLLLKDMYNRKSHKTINQYINKNVPGDVDKMFCECENTIKEARATYSLIGSKKIEELQENLSHIQNAIDSFGTNTNSSRWKTRFESVLTQLEENYQSQIQNLQKSVTTNQFDKIMEQRRVLQDFDRHLKPFVKNCDYKGDLQKHNQHLLSVISEWKKQFFQFENRTTLSKYPIGKLEKLVEDIPDLKEEIDQLIQSAENMLLSELEKVEDLQDPDEKLNQINSRITNLPQESQNYLTPKIKQKKIYCNSQEFKEFSKIRDEKIEQYSNQFIVVYNKYQNSNNENIRKDILKRVRCYKEKTQGEIINYINSKQLKQSISSLNTYQEMENVWSSKYPEITNNFQITLKTTIDYLKKLIIYLNQPNQSEEYLSQLNEFIDVLVDIEKNACLLKPLMNQIQYLFECFISYFKSQKNRFIGAINSLQIQEMLDSLNIIECQNSCLESILKMYDPKNQFRSSLQVLQINSLSTKATYPIIEDSFKKLKEDIANITLVKNTKKDRDNMFKRFGERASFANKIIKSQKQFEKFNPGYQVSIEELNSKLHKVIQECAEIIMQKSTSQGQLDQLKCKYENLISIQEHFLIGNQTFSNNFLEIGKALMSRYSILLEKGKLSGDISQFIVEIIDLKRIQNTIAEFSIQIFSKIDESLAIFMKGQTNKQSAINDLIFLFVRRSYWNLALCIFRAQIIQRIQY